MKKGSTYTIRIHKVTWLDWWFDDYEANIVIQSHLLDQDSITFSLKDMMLNWPGYLKLALVHPDDQEVFQTIHTYQNSNDFYDNPFENEIYTSPEEMEVEIEYGDFYLLEGTIKH